VSCNFEATDTAQSTRVAPPIPVQTAESALEFQEAEGRPCADLRVLVEP
jgi:hypothetical protein